MLNVESAATKNSLDIDDILKEAQQNVNRKAPKTKKSQKRAPTKSRGNIELESIDNPVRFANIMMKIHRANIEVTFECLTAKPTPSSYNLNLHSSFLH